MKNTVPFNYQGQPIRFSTSGWINATAAASMFGQEPRDWLRLHETEAYARALAKHLDIPFEPRLIRRRSSSKVSGGNSGFRPELSNCTGLVITKRGSANNGGGTWLHPKLAVAFARWLSPDFAVWCDLHIDALLRGELTEKQHLDRACQLYAEKQQVASQNGKELASWRWVKPGLEHEISHWRHQLQLTLGLD